MGTLATFTLIWLLSMLGAAVLLAGASLALRWVPQPVDRIRWIEVSLATAVLFPLSVTFLPWSWQHWEVPASPSSAQGLKASAAPRRDVEQRGAVERFAAGSTIADVRRGPAATAAPDRDGNEFSPIPAASSPAALIGDGEPSTSLSLDAWELTVLAAAAANIAAFSYFLIEWVVGALRLRRLCHRTEAASEKLRRAWQEVTGEHGEGVTLLQATTIHSPFVFGLRRSTVVVPTALVAAEDEVLKLSLGHEWAHLRRGDLWRLFALRCAQFLLWPQPLFWRLRRELMTCLDLLADDFAADGGREAVEYAELLLRLARGRVAVGPSGALTLLDRRHSLTRRVEMLLRKPEPWRTYCSWRYAVMCGLLLLFANGFIGGLKIQPAAGQTPAAAPAATAKTNTAASEVNAASITGARRYFGRVLDGETGKPIPDALIIAVRSTSSATAGSDELEKTYRGTDEEGRYEVLVTAEHAAVPDLQVALAVEHPEYAKSGLESEEIRWTSVPDSSGGYPCVDVKLWRKTEISGRVLDPNGRPCAYARVRSESWLKPYDANDPLCHPSLRDEMETDADGRFRLKRYTTGVASLWIDATGCVVQREYLDARRGELGDFKLERGLPLRGRVLGPDGRGLPDVRVAVHRVEDPAVAAENLRKFAGIEGRHHVGPDTQADGRFVDGPFVPGEYEISVTPTGDRPFTSLPGVYPATRFTLRAQDETLAEVKPVPSVELRVRLGDSAGRPVKVEHLHVIGVLPDERAWWMQAKVDDQGVVRLRAPRDLRPTFNFSPDEGEYAFRYRRAPQGPFLNVTYDLGIGTLDADVNEFEFVRYRSPSAIIRVVDVAGQPIKDYQVVADYHWREQPLQAPTGRRDLEELIVARRSDGSSRSYCMLPDEPTTFTISADGYESQSQTVSLREAEQRTLSFKLTKSPRPEQNR